MDGILQYGSLVHGAFGSAKYINTYLTEGDFWCADEPFYLVYRDDSKGNFDYTQPCDIMKDDNTSGTVSGQILDGATWQYLRRGVSRCGSLSEVSDIYSVVVSAGGVMQPPIGNDPAYLSVIPYLGGKFRLAWLYNDDNEAAEPTGFKIYNEDTDALLDTVTFRRRGSHFWLSDAFDNGNPIRFRVKTYRTVSETDYYTTGILGSGIADSIGPTAPSGLTVSED